MSNEVIYYDEIADFLVLQLNSNFRAMGKRYFVASGKGELKAGLQRLIRGGFHSPQLKQFIQDIPPLNLDVFVVIMNEPGEFELLINEIKDVNSLGLNELSQLIGYCLIANSKFGLLINIDGSVSRRFLDILHSDPYITHIIRLISYQLGQRLDQTCYEEHFLGVMKWNSNTKRLEYFDSGRIKSIPQLCQMITNILG